MLPLAHMGITVTLVKAAEKRLKAQRVDYRLLLVASLLPDIIDKPLGHFLFGTSWLSNKMFGHTLLFLLLLGGVGLVFWRIKHGFVPMTLFLGAAMHDVLDVMWLHPETFLWPLYGWRFVTPKHEAWEGTFQFGAVAITKLASLEIVGGLLLIAFFIMIALQKGIGDFLKDGKTY